MDMSRTTSKLIPLVLVEVGLAVFGIAVHLVLIFGIGVLLLIFTVGAGLVDSWQSHRPPAVMPAQPSHTRQGHGAYGWLQYRGERRFNRQ